MQSVECNAVDWLEAERILNDGQSLCLYRKEFSVYNMYVSQNFTLDEIDDAFEIYSEHKLKDVLALLDYNEKTVHFIIEWFDDAMPQPFYSHATYIVCSTNLKDEICICGDDLKEALTMFAARVINAICSDKI